MVVETDGLWRDARGGWKFYWEASVQPDVNRKEKEFFYWFLLFSNTCFPDFDSLHFQQVYRLSSSEIISLL